MGGVAVLKRQHLTVIIRWDAAHVVVNRRNDGERLTPQINASENLRTFGDARQALGQDLGIQVIEMEVDVGTLGTDTTAFTDLDGH